MAIVITGTPGVGKTTIVEALAIKLKALHLSISDLVRDENLILDVDEARKTLIADLKRLTMRVENIICEASQNVVVDGHFASDVVPYYLVSHVFVLRRDPEDLKVKLEERNYNKRKVQENVTSEILDVCLTSAVLKYGSEIVDEIDVTHLSVKEVVEKVLNILGGQEEVKVGKIDWLRRLEEDGRLIKLLKQINWS